MMQFIITIIIILLIVFFLYADGLDGETKREKCLSGIENIAQAIANVVSSIAGYFLEPKEKVNIRWAREYLAFINGMIYRYHYNRYASSLYSKERYEELFEVNDSLKEALKILGLSEDRWKKIAIHLSYIGCIRNYSRERGFDFYKKNKKSFREKIINETIDDHFGSAGRSYWKERIEMLKTALSYFQIPEEEWINYGDTVIEMHNINDNPDIEKYGIVQIDTYPNNIKKLVSISSPDSF